MVNETQPAARLRIEWVEPTRLREWPENPRVIGEDDYQALIRSLRDDPDLMSARPLIATRGCDWCPDGTVVAGNMRLRALTELGWGRVPVVYRELDREAARKLALRDNHQWGRWEDAGLEAWLGELAASDVDLASLGVTDPSPVAEATPASDPQQPHPAGLTVEDQYGVIVVCPDEAAQRDVYEQLHRDYAPRGGYEVRVVVV